MSEYKTLTGFENNTKAANSSFDLLNSWWASCSDYFLRWFLGSLYIHVNFTIDQMGNL